jgi:hypothetical protein
MRSLLRGLVAGALLSLLRAPLGIDLFQTAAVSGRTAYGWRAGALAAVALGLFAAGQSAMTARFLLAACAGYAVHGLLLANHLAPSGTVALWIVAILGFVALAALRESASAAPVSGDLPAGPPSPSPTLSEMIGLAVAGAGAAISIEAIARHLRIFEGGLARDDSLSGTVALVLLALGAAIVGKRAGSKPLRGLSTPLALAAAAAACFLSEFLGRRLATPHKLASWLHGIGMQPSSNGTLPYDVVLSCAFLALPLLLAGAAFVGVRGRNRLFAVLVGASIALALVPSFLEQPLDATATDDQPSISELVPFGSLVASAGALLAILAISDRRAIARWSGIGTATIAALPALFVEVDPLHVFSPWLPHPLFPLYPSDAPEGLVTVESFGILGGSWAFATVDRHRVTPEIEGAVADALRLRAAFELLPADRRVKGKLSVLLVGQLSPERARTLADGGADRVDRTAAWWPSMANVEVALWSSVAGNQLKPKGEILSIEDARERMRRGEYDLVVVPAVPGDPPFVHPSGAPPSTVVVRWIDLDEPAAHRDLGGEVAMIVDGLDRPSVAAVENASVPGDGRHAPILVRAGSKGSAPIPLVELLHGADATEARARNVDRFAAAERGDSHEHVTAGFAAFFDHQLDDPGMETGVRIPDSALELFRKAALESPPDPTTRRTWETLGHILAAQRESGRIETYLRPVAEKYAPWDALEKALARVDLEAKRPDDAMRRLDPIRLNYPDDFELWSMLGEAHCAGGDGAGAVECWHHAIDIAGVERNARREIAMHLAGCRDEDARAVAAKFLAEFPDDRELRKELDVDPSKLAPYPCAK